MSELKSYKMVDERYCDDAICVVPSDVYLKSEADEVIAEMKAEKEALLVKFRKFIDDHCAVIVTATRAVENLSPNIQMDFYEEFIKEDK